MVRVECAATPRHPFPNVVSCHSLTEYSSLRTWPTARQRQPLSVLWRKLLALHTSALTPNLLDPIRPILVPQFSIRLCSVRSLLHFQRTREQDVRIWARLSSLPQRSPIVSAEEYLEWYAGVVCFRLSWASPSHPKFAKGMSRVINNALQLTLQQVR